jgi:hypothetical protein
MPPRTRSKRTPRWLWIAGLLALAWHEAAAAVIGWIADHPTLTLTAAAALLAVGPRVRRTFR